jgi:hypothetical protein
VTGFHDGYHLQAGIDHFNLMKKNLEGNHNTWQLRGSPSCGIMEEIVGVEKSASESSSSFGGSLKFEGGRETTPCNMYCSKCMLRLLDEFIQMCYAMYYNF